MSAALPAPGAATRLPAGLAFIAVSAAAFGAMAIFARYAYRDGTDVQGVLLLRFVLAGGVLAALMLALRRPWPRGRALAVAMGMGAIGYVGQAACYFSALKHASAGLVALLLYTFPTIVCLFSALFLGERLGPRQGVLLAVSFAGTALMLGGGEGSATGIALALGAAAFYSVYIVVGARELASTDALASTTVVCLSAAATMLASTLFQAPTLPASGAGWAAMAAIAFVSTVLAILAFFAGLKRVGPSTASIASTLEPLVTIALAALLLGESLSSIQLIGGGLVLASAAWLAKRS